MGMQWPKRMRLPSMDTVYERCSHNFHDSMFLNICSKYKNNSSFPKSQITYFQIEKEYQFLVVLSSCLTKICQCEIIFE